VIGGARLNGGYGKVSGAVIGTFIFGVITNLLVLMNVSTFLQEAFREGSSSSRFQSQRVRFVDGNAAALAQMSFSAPLTFI
jgi:hypothetical protein